MRPDIQSHYRKKPNFVNIALGIYILLSALLSLYLFSRFFAIHPLTKIISILALLLCLLLIFSFKAPYVYKAKLAVIVTCMILGVYFLEGKYSGLFKKDIRTRTLKALGLDARNIYEVTEDFKKNGVHAVSFLTYYYFLTSGPLIVNEKPIIPLGSPSNTVTMLSNESGKWDVYESDEYEFSNPKGLYGDAEMVFLGDSFPQGYGVTQEKTPLVS